ncbi:MAG: hypothetical protein HYZ72_04895 [Deltaproteobacteria bacterium]|nr:hypothetical protein [Deltaproteobacteria bacterium]
MQHVQKLEPLAGQQPAITPLRVIVVHPSVWKRVRAWARRTLTEETVAEFVLGTATIFLTVCLFVGLARALEHYTIIPWP